MFHVGDVVILKGNDFQPMVIERIDSGPQQNSAALVWIDQNGTLQRERIALACLAPYDPGTLRRRIEEEMYRHPRYRSDPSDPAYRPADPRDDDPRNLPPF